MDSVRILKTDISVTTIEDVSYKLINNKSISVAVCNANTLVRCYKDNNLNLILNKFDIKCPDGFPVSKSSNLLYKNNQKRVDGYKLFVNTVKEGIRNNTSHYFFGNEEIITKKLISRLKNDFPNIKISGYSCPPFLNYKDLNEKKYVQEIIELKPDIVWVSLGFPKQEQFISSIQKNYILDSNFVGIGGVFDWVAGTKLKAPEFIANIGLEWVLRLIQEPKRLFKRYLIDNFLYIIYFIKQYSSK